MKEISVASALLLAGISASIASEAQLQFRKTTVKQEAFTTTVTTEILVGSSPWFGKFFRLRCEVYDNADQSIGVYYRDFSSGLPYRPLTLIANSFQRPTITVPRLETADHASCRLARPDDEKPRVDVTDVFVDLVTRYEVQIHNRSAFQLASVDFQCQSQDGKTTNYSAGGLGLSPFYTSPREPIRFPADECVATKVTVAPATTGLEGR